MLVMIFDAVDDCEVVKVKRTQTKPRGHLPCISKRHKIHYRVCFYWFQYLPLILKAWLRVGPRVLPLDA